MTGLKLQPEHTRNSYQQPDANPSRVEGDTNQVELDRQHLENSFQLATLPSTGDGEIKQSVEKTREMGLFPTYLQRGDLVTQLNAIPGLDAKERQQLAVTLNRLQPEDQIKLLNQLTTLATSTDAATPELKARQTEMLHSVVKDITNPQSIHQGVKATCTTTVLQSRLVETNPAEYARLMAELTLKGESTMAGGDKLTIDKSQPYGTDKGEKQFPGRSLSMDVFQTSLMQRAAEFKDSGAKYDDAKGLTLSSSGSYSGNFQDQVQYINDQLFNTASVRYDSSNVANGGISQPELLDKIKSGLSSQQGGVPVELNWSSGGAHMNHQVRVMEVRDGRVYFDNPWGAMSGQPPRQSEANGLESMSVEEFQSRIVSATINKPNSTAADSKIQGVDNRIVDTPTYVYNDAVTNTSIEVKVEQASPVFEFAIERNEYKPFSGTPKQQPDPGAGTSDERDSDRRKVNFTKRKDEYGFDIDDLTTA